MSTRARIGRLLGGPAVAAALLAAVPAQAMASTPTPAPVPPETASPAPAQAGEPTRVVAPETRRESAPRPAQVARIPAGAPETGGGSTADRPDGDLMALGALGLLGAGTAVEARRRRGSAGA